MKYRTHTCGELNITNVGQVVKLSGWIQKIRDLGKMAFIDLRDEFGITQIIVGEELQDVLKELTTESAITVEGRVEKREKVNEKIKTGEIEVIATSIVIVGRCKNVLPFEINSKVDDAREDLRLEYRFLDLRNEKLHNNILLRAKIMKTLRENMDNLGFVEIQTPILTSSSPEGARDFLVPSRLHPGEFYALPQAPQQFKQLLMISGFNKYYQIAPCFRDEDPRADRSPGEFYQLDMEMSFATQEDVFEVLEQVIPNTFKAHTDWTITEAPFVRIPYKEAMDKYGSDKPDLRNPLVINDVSDMFDNSDFNAFKNKVVKMIVTEKAFNQPRKYFDNLTEYAKNDLGANGLAWIKVDKEGNVTGSIAKFITEDMKKNIIEISNITNEFVAFFIAGEKGNNAEVEKTQKIAGGLRIKLGQDLDLLEKDIYKFCWIVDFPMYELSDEGTIDFNHNPFSMPQGGLKALEEKDPLEIYAYQYDLVCNGYEIASGAVRNHDPKIMVKAFEIAGYPAEEVEKRFGALFNAFQYGAPAHAGAAPGLDRIVMLLAKEDSIRQVIAFPKNKKARDLLMKAPNFVKEEQLKEVHIKVEE